MMKGMQFIGLDGRPHVVPLGAVVGFQPVLVQDPVSGAAVEAVQAVVLIGPLRGTVAELMAAVAAELGRPQLIIPPAGSMPPAPGEG